MVPQHEHIPRLPLFLLNTVLFPGDRLPLRVFEARYLDMVSACLKREQPFGICLIRHGLEVGEPAEPMAAGTLAFIEQWEMPQAGMLHILVRGGSRFQIERAYQENKLAYAQAQVLAEEEQMPVPEEFSALVELLQETLSQRPSPLIPTPHRLDDASWVGMRLGQLLPVANEIKQSWLEAHAPLARLHAIQETLRQMVPLA